MMRKRFLITVFILGAVMAGLVVVLPTWVNAQPGAANAPEAFNGASPFGPGQSKITRAPFIWRRKLQSYI
jgi:hypothetical protein